MTLSAPTVALCHLHNAACRLIVARRRYDATRTGASPDIRDLLDVSGQVREKASWITTMVVPGGHAARPAVVDSLADHRRDSLPDTGHRLRSAYEQVLLAADQLGETAAVPADADSAALIRLAEAAEEVGAWAASLEAVLRGQLDADRREVS